MSLSHKEVADSGNCEPLIDRWKADLVEIGESRKEDSLKFF